MKDMRKITSYPVAYRGSVKNLRAVKKPTQSVPGVYLFEFTDDYSVFDYGKMPDTIEGKGTAMAVMSAFIFEKLEAPKTWKELEGSGVWKSIEDTALKTSLLSSPVFKDLKKHGMRTHYVGLRNRQGKRIWTDALKEPTNVMEVKAVNIVRPERGAIGPHPVWNYNALHPAVRNFLIPLENVFRFGVPKGSSFLKRNPEYYPTLGLVKGPQEGQWLPFPVIEYFSKLEPGDRLLSLEAAVNFSGLSTRDFLEMRDLTLLAGLSLYHLFARAGIELWDGKLEFSRMNRIVLSDAVTPDELRLVKDGIQISKEPIRQYYRKYHPHFYDAVGRAKEIASKREGRIADIIKGSLGQSPERMDPAFKKAIEDMYVSLTVDITGLSMYPGARPMKEVIERIKSFGV